MRIATSSFFSQQVDVLSEQYEKMARYNTQIQTGNKLTRSSEDPVLAYRIKLTGDHLNNLQAYSQNGISARTRNQLFESAATQSINLLSSITQVMQVAGNDTSDDAKRATLGGQIQEYLNNLLNIANTRDGTGDYIFSGFNAKTAPFALANNQYIYNGGYESTSINIAPNNQVLYGESGYDVFGNILTGNGTFVISTSSSNTGTVWTDAGTLFDSSAYVADNYTITFAQNISGDMVYSVVGASTGQVVPPLPATIPNDAPLVTDNISFNGMTMKLTGTPNVGDTLTVNPSQRSNVFDTVNTIVSLLKQPINNDPVKRAQYHQALSEGFASMQKIADHIVSYQSKVGTRIQAVDNQVKENSMVFDQQKSIKTQLESADPIVVYTELKQQEIALQATQTSYTIVRNLLMELLKM